MVVVLVIIVALPVDAAVAVNSCKSSRSRIISMLAADKSDWSESSRSLKRLISRWHVCVRTYGLKRVHM